MQHGSIPGQAYRRLGITATLPQIRSPVRLQICYVIPSRNAAGRSTRVDRPPEGGAEQREQHASHARKRVGSELSTPEGFGDPTEHHQAGIHCNPLCHRPEGGSRLRHWLTSTTTKSTAIQTSDPGVDGRWSIRGNAGWTFRGCSTASTRPLSSSGTRVGGQELAPRPPCWSNRGTASAASPRICMLSTGAVALRWQPAASLWRHAGQLCVCEPRRRGCSGPRRRGGDLVCAWERRKIRVPAYTTETVQQQNNATPASNGITEAGDSVLGRLYHVVNSKPSHIR